MWVPGSIKSPIFFIRKYYTVHYIEHYNRPLENKNNILIKAVSFFLQILRRLQYLQLYRKDEPGSCPIKDTHSTWIREQTSLTTLTDSGRKDTEPDFIWSESIKTVGLLPHAISVEMRLRYVPPQRSKRSSLKLW